jgi:hypothetical protein
VAVIFSLQFAAFVTLRTLISDYELRALDLEYFSECTFAAVETVSVDQLERAEGI